MMSRRPQEHRSKRRRIEQTYPRRIIILAGAPSASSLDWGVDALSTSLLPTFNQRASYEEIGEEGKETLTGEDLFSGNSSAQLPVWRVLPLERLYLPSGLTPPDFQQRVWINQPEEVLNSVSFVSSASFTSDQSAVQDAAGTISAAVVIRDGENVEEARSQFLEQSMALHTELLSSQVLGIDERHSSSESGIDPKSSFSAAGSNDPITNRHSTAEGTDHNQSNSISSGSATSSTIFNSSPSKSFSAAAPPPRRLNSHGPPATITPLSTLPSARHVYAITPQTMTVNLVVALISVPSIRAIIPRHRYNRNTGGESCQMAQRPLELLELTVGDETRAGFGVNLWLPPPPLPPPPPSINTSATALDDSKPPGYIGGAGYGYEATTAGTGLRISAMSLRPRDIVLMRNVALGTWRGAVYGQSLRREVTRLEILWRAGGQGLGTSEIYAERELEGGEECGDTHQEADTLLAKARKVRRWVRDFLGPSTAPLGVEKGTNTRKERVDEGGAAEQEQSRPGKMRALPPDTQD